MYSTSTIQTGRDITGCKVCASNPSLPYTVLILSSVEMELLRDNADHLTSGGAQYVIAEALKMKAKGGWDAVRPALSTIVRYAIAHLRASYVSNVHNAVAGSRMASTKAAWARTPSPQSSSTIARSSCLSGVVRHGRTCPRTSGEQYLRTRFLLV